MRNKWRKKKERVLDVKVSTPVLLLAQCRLCSNQWSLCLYSSVLRSLCVDGNSALVQSICPEIFPLRNRGIYALKSRISVGTEDDGLRARLVATAQALVLK